MLYHLFISFISFHRYSQPTAVDVIYYLANLSIVYRSKCIRNIRPKLPLVNEGKDFPNELYSL